MNTYVVPYKTMDILSSAGKMWDKLIKWKSELDALNIPCEEMSLFADEDLFRLFTQSLLDGGISMMDESENILSNDLEFLGIKLWANNAPKDNLPGNNILLMKIYIYKK